MLPCGFKAEEISLSTLSIPINSYIPGSMEVFKLSGSSY